MPYKYHRRRLDYQKQWRKDHYEVIKGFRPIETFDVLTEDMLTVTIGPKDFVYAGTTKEPFKLWGQDFRVHVPRSLLSRARITVTWDTREIKGTSAMHSANK